jgi:hypothetical protein
MKGTVLLLFAVAVAAVAAVATTASAAEHSVARSGALHLTKDCGEYKGGIGEFCTIKSSNIGVIEPGMRVFYLATPGADGVLDSDIALSSGHGGAAVGHVVVGATGGRVTLSAGTGRFRRFRARARVSVDDSGLWHWDGTYHLK